MAPGATGGPDSRRRRHGDGPPRPRTDSAAKSRCSVIRFRLAACIVLLSAAGLCLNWQLQGLQRHRKNLSQVQAIHERTALDARTIRDLRARSEQASLHARPTQDVIARVHDALAVAGLPPDCFSELRNESDATLPATIDTQPAYRVQSLALSLHQVSIADLGAFFEAWGEHNPAWTVTRITLSRPRLPQNDGTQSYDVTLILSALYLEE